MFCPECRAEFQAGVSHCATCDVELVETPPEQDLFASPERMAQALADQELVGLVVGPHGSIREAQDVLSRARIPSVVVGDNAEEVETAMHTRFYLMVSANDIETAREVFEDRWRQGLEREGLELTRHDDVGDQDACPACGTAVVPEAEECPECGLHVGAAV